MRESNQHSLLPVAPILAALALGSGCAEPVESAYRWPVLGAEATARVWCTSQRVADEIGEEMAAATARVEAAVDVERENSELNELNRRAPSEPVRVVERDLYVCLKRSLEYARISNGAFDPTAAELARVYRRAFAAGALPSEENIERALGPVGWADVVLMPEAHAVRFRRDGMRIDLGVMADGLALDVAVRAFSQVGSQAGLLELRGAFQVWGSPPGERGWDVPLHDPREREVTLAWVRVDNRAVGVSSPTSVAERGPFDLDRPVIDPRTGRPPSSDVRVAVAIAEGAADASALAQALAVSGTIGGGALLARTRRVEAILVADGDGRPSVLASASLRDRLRLGEKLEREVGGRVRYILPPQSIDVDLGI